MRTYFTTRGMIHHLMDADSLRRQLKSQFSPNLTPGRRNCGVQGIFWGDFGKAKISALVKSSENSQSQNSHLGAVTLKGGSFSQISQEVSHRLSKSTGQFTQSRKVALILGHPLQLAELDRLSNLDSSVSSHRTWFIWVSLKRIKKAYPMVYEGLSTFIMIFSVKIVTTPFSGTQIPKYAI